MSVECPESVPPILLSERWGFCFSKLHIQPSIAFLLPTGTWDPVHHSPGDWPGVRQTRPTTDQLLVTQASHWIYYREGNPFQGSRVGSCLTRGNELSKETHVLTKQEILLGRGARVESSRAREPRRIALPRGLQSWVLW